MWAFERSFRHEPGPRGARDRSSHVARCQRRTPVVANAWATGSWTLFKTTIPAIAISKAATQPSKKAFIFRLSRLEHQAIYTIHPWCDQLETNPGDAKSRLLRCTLRNGRRLGPFQYGHGRIPREIADNVLVLRSTLPFRKRLRAAHTIRLIGCANPARGQGPATAARLDRPDQYGIGWGACRKSARSESAWNAGCARGIVENHDGAGQVGRFRYSSLPALLAISRA